MLPHAGGRGRCSFTVRWGVAAPRLPERRAMKITRLTTAEAQLNSSMYLLFQHQAISSYTLVFAARSLVLGLLSAQGKTSTWEDPRFSRELVTFLKNSTYKFWCSLKHANREQEDIRVPRLEEVAFMLYLTLVDFNQLVEDDLPRSHILYGAWFCACFPHVVASPRIDIFEVTARWPDIHEQTIERKLDKGLVLWREVLDRGSMLSG